MLIIGLMSGTSGDGIDAAIVDVTGSGRNLRARLLHFLCQPHDKQIRGAILKLCDPRRGRIPELTAVDALLGQRFAEAARAVADAAGVSLLDVGAIASHGQTIWHQPEPLRIEGFAARGTLQIGNPAVIAAETGCTVISDFRSADMAAGGEGAPLVPYADWALLRSPNETRAVQNIGGIANVTFLPRPGRISESLAFDTGPGNMVIDAVARDLSGGRKQYDKDGAWAARGSIHRLILTRMLDYPFFRQKPPKSTGRELFGEQYAQRYIRLARRLNVSDADLLATVTAATAKSIADAYARWLIPIRRIRTVILGGGGAHNRTLVRMLEERLSPARITTHAEFGVPDDAKEALAFALLGYETLRGRPSNVPSATGARYAAILGSITPAPESSRK